MNRILPALIVALVVAFATIWSTPHEAAAFTPWNVPNWPGIAPGGSAMTARVGQTATVLWAATDSYGWPGWHDLVAQSLNTGSSDSDSYGNVLNRFLASEGRGQITVREATGTESPYIIENAVPTAFLEAKCGDWATACVFLLNPLPVPAYFKAASMITWPYVSAAAVARHETNHPVSLACDQYKAGCPRLVDGGYDATVVCTGNKDTLMDCGGAATTVTAFDYATFKAAYPATTGFLQPAAPCGDPCWNGVEWVFGSHYSVNPATGFWFDPNHAVVWAPCNSLGQHWSPRFGLWQIPADRAGYDPAFNTWLTVPGC